MLTLPRGSFSSESVNRSDGVLTAERAHYLLMLHSSGSTLFIYPSQVMGVEEHFPLSLFSFFQPPSLWLQISIQKNHFDAPCYITETFTFLFGHVYAHGYTHALTCFHPKSLLQRGEKWTKDREVCKLSSNLILIFRRFPQRQHGKKEAAETRRNEMMGENAR